jgi:hypothetical protein
LYAEPSHLPYLAVDSKCQSRSSTAERYVRCFFAPYRPFSGFLGASASVGYLGRGRREALGGRPGDGGLEHPTLQISKSILPCQLGPAVIGASGFIGLYRHVGLCRLPRRWGEGGPRRRSWRWRPRAPGTPGGRPELELAASRGPVAAKRGEEGYDDDDDNDGATGNDDDDDVMMMRMMRMMMIVKRKKKMMMMMII